VQPTYQTPWERLSQAREDLLSLKCDDVLLRPLLFVCGLKLSYSYWRASTHGDERARYASAAHQLDDGLDEAAGLALKTLMKIAHSRSLQATLRSLPTPKCTNTWSKLLFACLKLPDSLSPRAKRWVAGGDRDANWIRLAFGMGARSLWDANEFALELIQTKFSVANRNGEDITKQIVEIVNRFTWDAAWVLPEM
jgi:hypothetical protein